MFVVNDVVNVMAAYQPVCKRAVHGRGRNCKFDVLYRNLHRGLGEGGQGEKHRCGEIISWTFLIRIAGLLNIRSIISTRQSFRHGRDKFSSPRGPQILDLTDI